MDISQAIIERISTSIAPGMSEEQHDLAMARLLADLARNADGALGDSYAETWRKRFVAFDVTGKPIEALDQLLDELHSFGTFLQHREMPADLPPKIAVNRTLGLMANMIATMILVLAEQQIIDEHADELVDVSGLDEFLDSLGDMG